MSSPSVLVVDDDQELNELLSKELGKSGYMTVQSTTVGDAKQKLSNQTFSLIVLDHQIGTQTAFELAQQLRSGKAGTAANQNTPIILISGFLSSQVVEKIAPLVQGIMPKPFVPEDLILKINQLLELNKKSQLSVEKNKFPTVSDDATNKEFRVFLHDFSSKMMILNLLASQLKNPTVKASEVGQKIEDNLQKIQSMIQIVRLSIKSDD
jgi:DNA-binding response OmpR family regulator